ncbi:MAG: hypothetical protein QOJ07_2198 [Thermoleophilaceae bacterium]|nr:hypothetical protein [Thermoleophilaceae bacterium]
MLRRSTAGLIVSLAAFAAALTPAAEARQGTAARVSACKTGDTADARSATFYGRMHTVSKSDRMLMRFTLVERFGDGGPRAVDVPALRAWHSAKPGVRVFGYSQTVAGLEGGGDYRARVDYRWLDSAGNLVRKSTRFTPICHQAGDLPNLRPATVSAQAGPAKGTAVYQVQVQNSGAAEARDVAVKLLVDGAATDVDHIDTLAAGETRTVRFTGPVCQSRLQVQVDPFKAIHELLESDNNQSFRCPAYTP